MLWNLDERRQVYANINQANEAPGITDITTSGLSNFQQLEVQESTTVEIGTRGQNATLSWDVSLYRSEIDNELIDFDLGGFSFTDNAEGDTIHQGIEAGLDWSPKIALFSNNDINFTWRHVLTVNDFRFKNDTQFGNNKLAGVPDFVYLTELNLLHESWKLALNARHVADGPYADFANTVQTDGYTLFELNGSYNVNDSLRVFFSIENITDEAYISNVDTSAETSLAEDDFTPGQGRGYFAGFDLSF